VHTATRQQNPSPAQPSRAFADQREILQKECGNPAIEKKPGYGAQLRRLRCSISAASHFAEALVASHTEFGCRVATPRRMH
jgi:hypothetical protein